MTEEITLKDDESLDKNSDCIHNFIYQADISIDGIIWDIYYRRKCLKHVKQERPCPLELEEIKVN